MDIHLYLPTLDFDTFKSAFFKDILGIQGIILIYTFGENLIFTWFVNGERISGAHLAILLCQPVPVKKVENVINNDQLIAL